MRTPGSFALGLLSFAVLLLFLPIRNLWAEEDGARENLLHNPSFESGMEGWSFSSWSRTGKLDFTEDSPVDERQCVLITNVADEDSTLRQVIPVKKNTRYRLSGYIKTEDVSKKPGASLCLYNTFKRTAPLVGTNDWTKVSLEFNSGKNDKIKVGPRLGYNAGKVAGRAWFDHLVLIELPEGESGQPGNRPEQSTDTKMEPGSSHAESGKIPDASSSNGLIKRNLTQVNGLLVLPLTANQHAAQKSTMTLSAIGSDSSSRSDLAFNQDVGDSMNLALREAARFVELRHGSWPSGKNLSISFENKYNPKDGPSAALACALLLESAFTGEALDLNFAVTGDINADGSVQAVGGIAAKIRGAAKGECLLVAIPEKNRTEVYDKTLMEGFGSVLDLQVFSVSSFDEAFALARSDKGDELKNAMAEFELIQSVYRNDEENFGGALRHPKMVEKLRKIIEISPNHLSASVLMDYAVNRAPETLSLHGSFSFIDENAYQIMDVVEGGKVARINSLDPNQVVSAMQILRRSKQKLDQRTWEWAERLLEFGELLHTLQTNRPNSRSNYNKLVDSINRAGKSVRSERKKLLETPEVMEELLE